MKMTVNPMYIIASNPFLKMASKSIKRKMESFWRLVNVKLFASEPKIFQELEKPVPWVKEVLRMVETPHIAQTIHDKKY